MSEQGSGLGIFGKLFGRFDWQAPPWWDGAARQVHRGEHWARTNRRQALTLGLVLLVSAALATGGVWWWRTRPKPQYVDVSISAPAAMDLTLDDPKPSPLVVTFAESAAPLPNIGKDVASGVTLSPKIEGQWHWDDERSLRFVPVKDWPVGQRYSVAFDTRALLAPQIRIEKDEFEFSSAPFTAAFEKAEFYQDPTEPQTKQIVVTVRFSHPVDQASLREHVEMRLKGQSEGVLGVGAERTKYDATFDPKGIFAYVRSESLALPEESTSMLVRVGEGVRPAAGGPATAQALERSVTVPGRFSLTVQDTALSYVDNERFETEQVLTVQMTEGVSPDDLRKRLRVWVLPEFHPDTPADQRRQKYEWNTPALVAGEILKLAKPVELESIPASNDYPSVHAFRYRADVGRWLYVALDKGLKSFGGYELGRKFDRTLEVPRLPQEVKILHSGALLSLTGDHKVSLYSRDVPAIRYEIARVLPDRLYLLASQTDGDFASPSFNGWSLDFDDLAERDSKLERVERLPAGRVQYHGFDLSPWLERDGATRSGVFLLTAQGYDPDTRSNLGEQDRRLVLLTDLGLLVKRSVDGTEDVFVQSIASGAPVAGAQVRVLGRNGVALFARTTDERGHAQLPSLRDFRRERAPTVYVVEKGGDTSFLPVDKYQRRLDYSRFDVGGVSNAEQAGALSGYLFSDRGIYRPGDEMRIGMIVKAASWSQPLAGVPLEAIVTDARGATVKRQRLRLSPSGFEEIAYRTSESSPTGVYNVSLHIVKDGEAQSGIGSTAVNVQEFQPDRMKLAVRFSEDREQGWVSPQDLAANVDLRTLFDTPAAGRRIGARMSLSPQLPVFRKWREYSFADPQKAKKSFDDELPEATTNEKGEAILPLRLERFEAGTYSLRLVVQGFEPAGGRAVTSQRSVLVSTSSMLVGVKADGELNYIAKDAPRNVEFIAVDRTLDRVAAAGLTLEQIERRWVSVLERQDDGTLRYESRLKELPMKSEAFALAATGTARALPTGTPGDYALVVRDAKGRELNRVEYSVAGVGNVARRLDRNAELGVTLAKTDYAPGEEIEVSIRAPYAGSGLIAIERERVHTFQWFHADSTSSVQRIRLPDDFDGNGYVTVTFVRDAASPEIFASPLSYGVAPFSVDVERRKVAPAIRVAEVVKPGETLEVRYSTPKPTRIVVFGVDEGILQVAGYRTPNPLGFFFEKRALEVDTQQILDLILPQFQQLLAAAPGGDAEGDGARFLNPFRRKRDAPVVFWSGIIDAGPEAKTFRYSVPDYFNGSMRVMAVAVAADSIGVVETKSVVRGDFVILPNAPTSVAPGDEFDFTAGVTNNVAGATAALDVATTLAASEHFAIVGAPTVTTSIGAAREATVKFRLRAKDVLGSGTLTLQSRAGAKSAKLASTVSIRPATPFYSQITIGSVRGGAKDIPVTRSLFPQKRELEVGASFHPLAVTTALESFLDEYPYGCTEQLVSKALPAVVLAKRGELGSTNIAAAGERYDRLIVALRARQNEDGSFSYWPGRSFERATAAYPSVYAMHFLVEAQARGQNAPRDMLERGGEWLAAYAAGSDDADKATLGDDRSRAYAIYVLTRMGRVSSNYANALVERLDAKYRKTWRSDITAAYLGGAYRLMKQDALARELISGVSFTSPAKPWKIDYSDTGGGFYYSALTHDTQLLFFLAKHFPERLRGGDGKPLLAVVDSLARERNTLSSAWTVLAFDAYAAIEGVRPLGDLKVSEIAKDNAVRALAMPAGLAPRVSFSPQASKLRIAATGDLPAFYSVTEAGFDRGVPAKAIAQGFEIFRELVDANGKPVTAVKQGDEVLVRVRVRSLDKRWYWDGVVVDMMPGGFEPILDDLIRAPDAQQGDETGCEEGADTDCSGRDWQPSGNQTAANQGKAGGQFQAEYVDVREDRIVAFGPIGPNVQEFTYRVRATTAGKFVMPPAYAESMYDPRSVARSLATTVEVSPR